MSQAESDVRAAVRDRPDASAEVVISIGVFNLCPDKPRVLAEAFGCCVPAVTSRWPTSCCTTT